MRVNFRCKFLGEVGQFYARINKSGQNRLSLDINFNGEARALIGNNLQSCRLLRNVRLLSAYAQCFASSVRLETLAA